MIQLPHYICVRLLADVAAVLRPSIVDFADRDTLNHIDQSISQAKTAADGDLPRPSLEDLSITATQLTGKLEFFSQGLFFDDADRESHLGRLSPDQLALVRDVADIAARSLRAAVDDESNANTECQEGLSWAYDVAERLSDDELQGRIQTLVDNAIQ
ncbi:MAG: hypothetical protein KDB00_11785 [Planctomycetales bacterium]|nr:hypothetical protein [Planctomycetales bacterium]